jgi:hypothetical protein
MRIYLPVVISVLIGVVLGGLLFLPMAQQSRSGSALSPVPTEGVVPSPPFRARLVEDALAAAQALFAAGRLRDAQDAYIEALLLVPDNAEAWAGLVRVRRRLARDDPALLRRQADVYRRVIARGGETEEHYAVPAMRVLAEASVRAAQQIEESRPPSAKRPDPSPIVLPATPRARTAATPAPARPTPRVTRRAVRPPVAASRRAARPVAPTARPTRRQTARPTPRPAKTSPPAAARAPLFLVQAGPLVSPSHTAEVLGALRGAGYAGRVTQFVGSPYYLLTVGPYRKQLADAVVRFLTSRFPELTVALESAR